MRLRCSREQAVTQSRICADAYLRLGGSAAFQRKRAAPVFVTGWKPRESLSAPVAETIPMATAVQKITLSSSRDIPFNKLVLSQSNVRRVKAGVSIEELAEDIARRTLLQGLNVRPVLDADGVRDRHVRGPGRRAALPGAPASRQTEASRQDRAGALRRARSQRRHLRRGRLVGRERPARAAASARSVPRLSGPAREGPVRGGDRRRLLRRRERGEAAAASRGRVGEAARRLCRRRHVARPAHGVHGDDRSRASGAGLGNASALLQPGAVSDPPHADGAHRARFRQARAVRRPRCL